MPHYIISRIKWYLISTRNTGFSETESHSGYHRVSRWYLAHAWTCTLFRSIWSARPHVLSNKIHDVDSLWIIMTSYMTHLIGWLWPYLSLLVDPSLLDGCIHTLDPSYCTLYYGWLHPYHISCIWDISCICLRRFSDGSVFSWRHSHKAFHPSLSLGPHALGGICYRAFCHRPYNPSSRTLEDYSRDLWIVNDLKPPSWHTLA